MVLTDYDFVTRIGESRKEPGTIQFCSPSYLTGSPAGAADDIYALAASFFHVLFDRDPFTYDGHRDKDRGLNWSGIRREDYPILAPFLDRATHPDPAQRFPSVAEALTFLRAAGALQDEQGSEKQAETSPVASGGGMAQAPGQPCREEEVEWLRHLLQSYPGSRYGNRETRGLDTDFAARTYVETGLEKVIERAIRERRARLVILCGNAGDGKTALLQHLARRLGMGELKSSQRVHEHRLKDGLTVRIILTAQPHGRRGLRTNSSISSSSPSSRGNLIKILRICWPSTTGGCWNGSKARKAGMTGKPL